MKFDYRNIDCMVGMAEYPDKYFDLAIVDPPFGINITKIWGKAEFGYKEWEKKEWDISVPLNDYFEMLFIKSKNQIIWGGNYFPLPPSQCWIIWDKGQRDFTLADGEMAWTSFNNSLRIFEYSRALANKQFRIHPTQKPIALYKWLLTNYAKQGDKILDTHVGSASSIIACLDLGFEVTGFELDADYYKASMERINKYLSEPKLFKPEEIPTKQENNLFE